MTQSNDIPLVERLQLYDELENKLSYISATGQLVWKESGRVAGGLHKSTGYWRIQILGKYHTRSKLVWCLVNKKHPEGIIDHINRIRTDDRIENLRECSASENMANKGKLASNSSGFTGVTWHNQDKKWQAAIKRKGKSYHLGHFDCPEKAHQAYRKKHVEFHGKFSPYYPNPVKSIGDLERNGSPAKAARKDTRVRR